MANLIRLKQIESGSALQTSAEVGADFSQSVIGIITGQVAAVLPDGIVSGSSQIFITDTMGYNDIATDIEVAVVSSSISSSQILISSSISSSLASALSESLSSITILSSSVDSRLDNLELFSSSLDNTFATDVELSVSQSNLNVDMGEW
jgi:hypothetical protein